MKFSLLSIFPEMFPSILGYSLTGKAIKEGKCELDIFGIRDYANPPHYNIDDTPYGGGDGMLMRADIVGNAVDAAISKNKPRRLIYPSPKGMHIKQKYIDSLIKDEDILILCGRFEGVDQRIIDYYEFEEVSLGDFVLSGGEFAAFAIIDACIRKLDGVINSPCSFVDESFSEDGIGGGLLEYPHYTRPSSWKGLEVPPILLSGDHAKITKWRREKSLEITREKRPDLLDMPDKD